MSRTIDQTPILPTNSLAYRANLPETAVEHVTIDPRHDFLRQAVGKVSGVLGNLDRLLLEMNHPYRNWRLILPELRTFALKNAARFILSPQGPICLALFAECFLRAARESDRSELRHEALTSLTAYLETAVLLLPRHQLDRFAPICSALFATLAELPDADLLLLSQSRYPVRKSANLLLERTRTHTNPAQETPLLSPEPVCNLAINALRATYRHWLQQPDPARFVESIDPASNAAVTLGRISHAALQERAALLTELARLPPSFALIDQLSTLPSFVDIVRSYREAAEQLGTPTPDSNGHLSTAEERSLEGRKLRFMFHILNLPGLSMIHEETLREVNRSLVHLVKLRQGFRELETFFLQTFQFLREYVVNYPATALHCIEALGTEIFRRNNSRLVEAFLGQTVRFGFQHGLTRGSGSSGPPTSNPFHLDNLRIWLNLVRQQPRWCSTLLSALIINLRLTGTCIRDTDLFQKEVSLLLNSDITPVFNLVKQFARLLPVYYNEIGAEGELREVSTELDEITRRQDRLIHFLRKQCHVESTNLIVDLVRAILQFWRTGERELLRPFLPPPVLEEVAARGPHFDPVHRLLNALFTDCAIPEENALLDWPLDSVESALRTDPETPASERRRLFLLIRLYQLLHRKYCLGHLGIPAAALPLAGLPHLATSLPHLLELLERRESGFPLLTSLLDTIEALRTILLAPEAFPAEEAIFQKRHIAADIPSVYGYYRERKFDALSLTFRLESLAAVELEQLCERIPEGFITRAALFRIAKYLRQFLRALDLDGINARKFNNYLEVLDRSLSAHTFSFPQYLDIFRGFADGIREIIYAYTTSHHRDNLVVIVPTIPALALNPRFAPHDGEDPVHHLERVNEIFLRDLIAGTFGLQALDRFINRIRRSLLQQAERLAISSAEHLLGFDPTHLFCSVHHPLDRTNNLLHLGNKGFNLVQLASLGLPVPPGVIITTEFCRCLGVIRDYPPAREDFTAQLRQQVADLEQQTGRRFGDPERPLLLSVRSGALISMPGMMQTIHNVGINLTILEGLIRHTHRPFFAWDTYRRFLQSWSMTHHLRRDTFNQLMRLAKQRHGVRRKGEFSGSQMAELAMSYRQTALASGIIIPDDPWEQLQGAILQVVDSWHSTKAREYRRIMDISDQWGTAVVLQAMVFGNLHDQAGSGVVFTAHPHRQLDRVVLWGDYTPGNQGEDIVSGLVTTLPVSVEQCRHDERNPETSLERQFPAIFDRLLTSSRQLVYQQRWNPQEIEFTFEGPRSEDLYLLQTRDMVTSDGRRVVRNTFRKTGEMESARLAQGIGVSGGVLCGKAVFNAQHIENERVRDPKAPLILIRFDTVPDDIREISLADGLLTTRGGQTSHAAIVAARLNKVCVVGCEEVCVRNNEWCEARGTTIRAGDPVSIDGNRGWLLAGWHPVEPSLAE